MTEQPGSLFVLAAVRDATVRNELRAELNRVALEAQREQSRRLESLSQSARGVAHDFNNVLGVILNYTTLLSRRQTEPSALADLAEIRAAVEQGGELTRQLLSFARRDVSDLQPLEVNDIVSGVASMLDPILGEDVELGLDLAAGSLVALTDRHQLEQILLNLAINAHDAMPTGGILKIGTRRMPRPTGAAPVGEPPPTPNVALSVADTGCGMTAEVMARAFEPFFTTKPRGMGAGLGLAAVYGIAREGGGEVTIESTPGAGTTVTVVLCGAEPASLAGPAVVPAVTGGHERILLVEDEAALRAGTARLLVEQGYEVLLASDGIEALDVLDNDGGNIDLVVTDMAMPRMRGDELVSELAGRWPGLQVILMSGSDSGDAPLKGRQLAKPVAKDVLMRTVREVLDGRP